MRILAHWIGMITILLAGCAAQAADAPAPRAVLVGIGSYANADSAGLKTLHGPKNDVTSIRAILTERYGLTEANTTVLLDQQATRSALLSALRRVLVDEALPGGVVLFYFSGHGSRVYDSSLDEPSQLDSTILPYDARTQEQPLDITDDELGTLVAASLAKGAKPVVVLDSCNSGTGMRFVAQARSAPPAKRTAPVTGRAVAPQALREVTGGYGILLAAAQDNEEALEMERDGTIHGEFTRALVAELRRAEPGVTYLDVLTRVRVGLASLGVPHRPQGEGNLEQRFLGSGPLGQSPVLAESVDGKTASMGIGAASGVTQGSKYDFFASAAAAAAGKSPLVGGVVERVLANSAVVRLAAVPSVVPSRLFALERSHAYGELKLRVALVGGTPERRLKLASDLGSLDFVSLVPSGAATHWLQIGPTDVQLLLANGTRVGSPMPVDATTSSALVVQLRRLAHVQALLGLTNTNQPRSPVTANIVLASASSSEVKVPSQRDGEARLPAGQTFKLRLFNTGSAAKHVYVLNISPDLCVELLSPPPYGKDDPLSGLVSTKLLRAGPERGREYFLVLAADQPVALESLRQPCAGRGATRSAARQFDDPLAQLLFNAASGRRAAESGIELDGWSTSFLSMVVE
jgi:hypothetical protein